MPQEKEKVAAGQRKYRVQPEAKAKDKALKTNWRSIPEEKEKIAAKQRKYRKQPGARAKDKALKLKLRMTPAFKAKERTRLVLRRKNSGFLEHRSFFGALAQQSLQSNG